MANSPWKRGMRKKNDSEVFGLLLLFICISFKIRIQRVVFYRFRFPAVGGITERFGGFYENWRSAFFRLIRFTFVVGRCKWIFSSVLSDPRLFNLHILFGFWSIRSFFRQRLRRFGRFAFRSPLLRFHHIACQMYVALLLGYHAINCIDDVVFFAKRRRRR